MNENKQPDRTNMTQDQIAQLDAWQSNKDQLETLRDIAAMTQEIITLFDDQQTNGTDTSNQIGSLLMSMRDSLTSIENKDTPDVAQPIVDALHTLETAFSKAIKTINVQPVVNVDAPNVNVEPVDLSGVQEAISVIPKAFREAIKLIPQPEQPDYSPLLDAWTGISQQLLSIENATRMKPLPGSMKVSNPYPYGFAEDSNLNTEIVTVDTIKVITQTDGTKTSVTTIDSTNEDDKLITRIWSINGI